MDRVLTRSLFRERLERLSVALDRQLTPKRIRLYASLVLSLWITILIGVAAAGDLPYNTFDVPISADLTNRFIGADILLDGDATRLYDLDRQAQAQAELFSKMPSDPQSLFVSPPLVAYVYAPLALLPYTLSALIWLLISVVLVFLSLRLLWPIVPNVHRHGIGLIVLLLFASQPMIELLGSGQDAALSLFVLTAGLRLLLSGREGLAGAVLGFGVFKPQLFVFMPIFFLVTRRWRALAAWLAVAAALVGISVATVGLKGTQGYISLLRSDAYVVEVAANMDWKMQSLVAMTRTWLPESLLHGMTTHVISVIMLGAAIGALWKLNSNVKRRIAADDQRLLIMYAATVVAIGLFSPHFFQYDSVILALPVLIVLQLVPLTRRFRLGLAAVFILGWATPFRYVLFEDRPWPIPLLNAPWAVLFTLFLFFTLHQYVVGARSAASEQASRQVRSSLPGATAAR